MWLLLGQVENAEVRKPKYGNWSMETEVQNWSMETEVWKRKYGNGSMETEVWKWKYGNGSMETEVWKPKYGNRSMETACGCLVPYWLTNLPCMLPKGDSSLWCESRILSSRIAASIAITNCTCDSQTQTKTNGEWANHTGSMLLDCSTSNKTTPETLAYIHCSLGMRPSQDYTLIVSSQTTVLVVTGVWCVSVQLSYRFETVILWLQGTIMRQ